MVPSPDPVTSHSDFGLPGSWFSAGIGLLACALMRGPTICNPNMSPRNKIVAPIERRRRVWLCSDVIFPLGRHTETTCLVRSTCSVQPSHQPCTDAPGHVAVVTTPYNE